MPFYMTGRVPASRACNYLQNLAATTYKKFLQFYAKRSCKKQKKGLTLYRTISHPLDIKLSWFCIPAVTTMH